MISDVLVYVAQNNTLPNFILQKGDGTSVLFGALYRADPYYSRPGTGSWASLENLLKRLPSPITHPAARPGNEAIPALLAGDYEETEKEI